MRRGVTVAAFCAALCLTAYGQVVQTGKISGKLTYPSDHVPPEIVICVQNTTLYAEPTVCSDTSAPRLAAANTAFRINTRAATYSITLPAGRYYVYGTFRRGRTPSADMVGFKAFYNEFVRCGMSVNCRSKRPIEVVVRSGKTVTGITVGDWY